MSAKKRAGGRSGECANVQSGRRQPATGLSRRLAVSERLVISDEDEGVHTACGWVFGSDAQPDQRG